MHLCLGGPGSPSSTDWTAAPSPGTVHQTPAGQGHWPHPVLALGGHPGKVEQDSVLFKYLIIAANTPPNGGSGFKMVVGNSTSTSLNYSHLT